MLEEASPAAEGRPSIVHLYAMLAAFVGVILVLLVIQLTQSGPPREALAEAHDASEHPEIFETPLLQGLDALGPEEGSGYDVAPPPLDPETYPCSDCHEAGDEDPRPRELYEPHDAIQLDHGRKGPWCYTCHSEGNRDVLELADGTQVPFEESYGLCGQCHGPQYRDWRAGIHGRRVGRWDGEKRYLLCAHCHDPHAPRFKKLKPLPPPAPPYARYGEEDGE